MTFHRILWHYVSISKHLLEFCVEGQAVVICSMYLTTNSFVVPKTLSDNVTFPKSKAWFSMSVTSMYSMYLCTYHEMFVSIKHVHFRICFQSILSGKETMKQLLLPLDENGAQMISIHVPFISETKTKTSNKRFNFIFLVSCCVFFFKRVYFYIFLFKIGIYNFNNIHQFRLLT